MYWTLPPASDPPAGRSALAGVALAVLTACGGISDEMPTVDGSPGGSTADSGPGPADARPDATAEPTPDTGPPVCQDGVTQLLLNPGFDVATPEDNAVEWAEIGGFITYPEDQIGLSAHSDPRAAWFGKIDEAGQRLRQTVDVPKMATSLELRLYICFTTLEDVRTSDDKVTIALLGSADEPLEVLQTYSNLDAGTVCNWSRRDLSAAEPHAGERITLEFQGSSDGAALTSFFFDTLSLNAIGVCPD